MHPHMSMILGRLLERSEQTILMIGKLDARVATLEKRKEEVPAAETWFKRAVTIGAPLGTLWLTGSQEKAVQVLQALLTK